MAKLREPRAGHVVAGELIAIGRDTVFVLTESGLEALPEAELRAAQVASYQSARGELALWTCMGTLSTASHGVGLVLTAPLWIIGGTICTVAASGAGIHRYPQVSLGEFAPFARFPQGLPPEVRDSGLLQNRQAVTSPTSPKK